MSAGRPRCADCDDLPIQPTAKGDDCGSGEVFALAARTESLMVRLRRASRYCVSTGDLAAGFVHQSQRFIRRPVVLRVVVVAWTHGCV